MIIRPQIPQMVLFSPPTNTAAMVIERVHIAPDIKLTARPVNW
jgi:hypothetical protein